MIWGCNQVAEKWSEAENVKNCLPPSEYQWLICTFRRDVSLAKIVIFVKEMRRKEKLWSQDLKHWIITCWERIQKCPYLGIIHPSISSTVLDLSLTCYSIDNEFCLGKASKKTPKKRSGWPLGGGSRRIGPRTVGPQTVGPRTVGPRTVP